MVYMSEFNYCNELDGNIIYSTIQEVERNTGELLEAAAGLVKFSPERVGLAPTAIFWPSDDLEYEAPIRGEKLLAVAELSDAASVCLSPRSELLRGFKPT